MARAAGSRIDIRRVKGRAWPADLLSDDRHLVKVWRDSLSSMGRAVIGGREDDYVRVDYQMDEIGWDGHFALLLFRGGYHLLRETWEYENGRMTDIFASRSLDGALDQLQAELGNADGLSQWRDYTRKVRSLMVRGLSLDGAEGLLKMVSDQPGVSGTRP